MHREEASYKFKMQLTADSLSTNNLVSYSEMSTKATASEEEMMALLPGEFVPGKWDVICQRGKECYDHGESSRTFSSRWCY